MIDEVPDEFKETPVGIAEILDINVKLVHSWIERAASNGFPDTVVHQMGKYKFYDIRTVRRWYNLHNKATGNMRSKNAKRPS